MPYEKQTGENLPTASRRRQTRSPSNLAPDFTGNPRPYMSYTLSRYMDAAFDDDDKKLVEKSRAQMQQYINEIGTYRRIPTAPSAYKPVGYIQGRGGPDMTGIDVEYTKVRLSRRKQESDELRQKMNEQIQRRAQYAENRRAANVTHIAHKTLGPRYSDRTKWEDLSLESREKKPTKTYSGSFKEAYRIVRPPGVGENELYRLVL